MDDALQAAKNLGIKLEIINIENAVNALGQALEEQFKDTKNTTPSSAFANTHATASPLKEEDTTEENIQSRIRGNILMALSNKFGNLLLSTGNKSEMAVGYATIYGDMCGAFNPIKDLYKTEVFKLAKWRNENIPTISIYQKTNLIPQNIITKEPTAELRDNQKDSDSLPSYEILDQILYQLIEEEKSIKDVVRIGFDEELVLKINKLFINSEYKRAHAVLGCNLSKMPFDKGRRYPITNKF
jgi:NAD+ synthase